MAHVIARRVGSWLVCAMLVLGPGQRAFGQWTAISLHPPGALGSYINAGSNGMFGGAVELSATPTRPALWSGLSTNWTNLNNSTGPVTAGVNAMWGDQQGGYFHGAALWSGTPESRIDMGGDEIRGMGPGQQVGSRTVQIGGVQHDHAVLWSGTPASMIDLNPAGYADSHAQATDGQHQGGWVYNVTNGGYLATMWSGTAASAVSMNPSWASGSDINGMAPGQQVGSTQNIGQLPMHATIWSGTAQSAINVDPYPLAGGSVLNATNGSVQVGDAGVPGFSFQHAGVWFGSAASFVDLHQFLPPGYFISTATCVQEWNGQILVGGWAQNNLNYTEAFVWVLAPAPGVAPTLIVGMAVLAKRRGRSSP